MSERITIAVARTESEFVAMMKRRRHEVGMAQIAFDEHTGWQLGYVGKLECPNGVTREGKRWGRRCINPSFFDWLAGLGCVVAIVPRELLESHDDGGRRRKPQQLTFAFADDLPPIELPRKQSPVYIDRPQKRCRPAPKAAAA